MHLRAGQFPARNPSIGPEDEIQIPSRGTQDLKLSLGGSCHFSPQAPQTLDSNLCFSSLPRECSWGPDSGARGLLAAGAVSEEETLPLGGTVWRFWGWGSTSKKLLDEPAAPPPSPQAPLQLSGIHSCSFSGLHSCALVPTLPRMLFAQQTPSYPFSPKLNAPRP